MPFTITADLPLGTYRGASADGRAEALPSVSRLYSALLCAAGLGPRAVPRQGQLSLDPADERALHWLEENPPDAVQIPQLHVNTGRATAYRDDGTLKKSRASLGTKKLAKSPDMSVAVAGAFQWTWTQDPPPGVVDALSALCPDVPYLGTTESPVRLTATSNRPAGEPGSQATHILDPQASMFAAVGQDVEVPVPGRLTELTAAHRSMTGRSPSLAKDRYGTDETSQSPVPPREAVAVARYAPVQAPAQDVPWPQVVLLPVDQKIKERHRVRWAVAVHRALIRIIGDGAPPLVTGIYPQPASRPANRLAVQVVDDSMPVDLPAGVKCAIALMIPAGVEAGDLAVLAAAVENLTILYGPSGSVQPLQVAGPVAMAGGRFWRPRPVDTVRVWGTQPPAVPDVRGVRGVEWTFAHAALLSVGFVLKSRLGPVPGRRDARYLNVVDAVTAAGAAVLDVRPERTTGVQDYAHTVHAHAVIRPYRARLVLGDLVTDQALLSIGQSRHLGGGLLVPVDLPEGAPMSDAALPPQGRAR